MSPHNLRDNVSVFVDTNNTTVNMSEKWETVGTGKVNTNKGSKGKMNGTKAAANGKKTEQRTYSMEDVLPASSVKNMYQAAFDPSPPSPKKDAKQSK